MSGPALSVGRGVIVEMARLAAYEVPGVLRVARGGPAWRAVFRGPSVAVRVRHEQVDVRLWIVARPGADLASVGRHVRAAVAAAVERLLGLKLGSVTVVVDGVGT
ncbi:MAG TPA: Asp23/Gls24 family envelope stress response protein [Candidatus Limnocylindrales bacterium]|nr:Asp23/Gls24 family envelope stress response protein [Candidatus Limnocylindrales bacterium]